MTKHESLSLGVLLSIAVGLGVTPAAPPAVAQSGAVRPSAQGKQDPLPSGRLPRPEPNVDLRVEKLPPKLEQILKEWENASSRIRTLEGKHYRWVYDLTFNVEKRAEGVFYYEAPDKGRIDIKARKPEPGEVSQRVDPKTKKPFEIQPDFPQKWICDGQAVWQINDEKKTAERYEIPPEHRGRNIIDGPLPFLFGMPAEKAKQRYVFKLLRELPTEVWLDVTPRWKQDAANFRKAIIILDTTTYLPRAVKLIDPGGYKETVFQFRDLRVNKKERPFQRLFGVRDPFRPSLRGYKLVNHSVKPPQQPGEQKQARVPSVIGFNWQAATTLLKRAGYQVKYVRGEPATREELVFVVYQQKPAPKTTLPKGSEVVLTLYDRIATSSRR